MAEAIVIFGLIHSILTLLRTTQTTIDIFVGAKTGPEEIVNLQGELENFDIVIQEIASFKGDKGLLNGLIHHELSRSKETIRQVQTFINTSLLRKKLPSRLKWFWRKGRAEQLREELRSKRNQLLLVMMALNSASASRTSNSLEKLAIGIAHSQRYTETMNQTLQTTQVLTRQILRVVKDGQVPVSAFELSQNFFPEQYSISATAKRIRVYDSSEISCSSTTRVDEYHFFYSATPRKWHSLSLTVTTTVDSVFWDLCRPPRMPERKNRTTISKRLEDELENQLREAEPSDDLMALSIDLGADHWQSRILPGPPDVAKRLLDFIRDLGCPMYSEEAIAFQLHAPQPRHFVCALPDGTLCSERRLRSDRIDLEALKWELSLYRCLQDSVHTTNLLGVVTDNKVRYVKSILRDAEPGGIWGFIQDAAKKEEVISLNTRFDWARQIVAGIRDIHEKGFVVGKLETHLLGQDSRGNIQLHGFCKSGYRSELHPIFTAPEFRTQTMDSECRFTSRSDLFQLGILLWQIAEFDTSFDASLWTGYSWFDPSSTQPPKFKNAQIPDWYIKIVNACQSVEPESRLPASELLELFPPTLPPAQTNTFQTSRVLWNSGLLEMGCNKCMNVVTRFYNCRICDDGDYDICGVCVGKEIHCEDGKHFLEEIDLNKQSGACESTGRYHSKITSDGEWKDTILYLK